MCFSSSISWKIAGHAPGWVRGAPAATALEPSTERGTGIRARRRSSRTGALAAGVAALAIAAGCTPDVQGNGMLDEETRPDLAPFVGIHIESGNIQPGERLSAVVTSGQAQSVKVIGDANLVPDIITVVEPEVVGTTTFPVLHVRVDAGTYDPSIPPQVVVSAPTFFYVHAGGSSLVQVKNASTPELTVNASGTSSVSIAAAPGESGDLLDVRLRDESALDATAYPTAGATVDLAGETTAKLHSDGPVEGSAAGDSVLNNLLGAGNCDAVDLTQNAAKLCNP